MQSFFDRLTVRQKLNVFLAIPLLAMTFFFLSMVSEKQNDIRSTIEIKDFSAIVRIFSNTVHQLQLERSLSQGVLAKQQGLYLKGSSQNKKLIKQRQQTDKAIARLKGAVRQTDLSDLLDQDKKETARLLLALTSLDHVRKQIDHGIDNNAFALYSHLIERLIETMERLQTLPSDVRLNNLAGAYLSLIWLEELAGQERGKLNGLLFRKTYTLERLSQLSEYNAGQAYMIHWFFRVAPKEFRRQLEDILSSQASLVVKHYREITADQIRRQQLLNKLFRLIGYGGLIHHYKNYLLRLDKHELLQYQQDFSKLLRLIDDYRHLSNITAQESAALNIVEHVFKQYQMNLDAITEWASVGMDKEKIDALVRVDDKPALTALEFLYTTHAKQPEIWWQNATQRINSIHQLSSQLMQLFQQEISTKLKQTRQQIYIDLLGMVTAFFVAIGIGFYLRKRLVSQLKQFAEIVRKSRQNAHYHPLPDKGNDEIAAFAKAYNLLIEERSQHEAKLQLAAKVFNHTHEGIVITDAENKIIDVNPAFSEITGYSREDVIGKKPDILSSGRQDKSFYQTMWETLKERDFWQGEIWNRNKQGQFYAELLSIRVLRDKQGDILHYLGVFSDITQNLQQQEQLRLMAHYDALTGLPNRILLRDRFSQGLAHSKRMKSLLAVCYLDLDNFKPINDKFGHKVGDELLIEAAKRMSRAIREEDTVCRLGGDEFAILLSDIFSVDECLETLSRVHDAIARPYLIANQKHFISVSIGFTLYPDDNVADLDALLRHADQAMYSAKQRGGNNFQQYDVVQEQQILHLHVRQSEIEEALKNQQLQLYVQPKLNMATGKVVGVEALMRWLHPEKGLIPPLEFLPFIREGSLEIKVGNWVIDQALQYLSAWKKQGIDVGISVNISANHLTSPHFYEQLERMLAQYPDVDSQQLQVEMLESYLVEDISTVQQVISDCRKKLGISVALDDFGTGYSSLTHLRNISVDTVKIDQSFIRDVLDDANDYVIVDSVIELAKAFNRDVVAEGVETVEQGLLLMMLGCTVAQGYGIARPMPEDAFLDWLNCYQPEPEWLAQGDIVLTKRECRLGALHLAVQHIKKHLDRYLSDAEKTDSAWLFSIADHKACLCAFLIEQIQREGLVPAGWLDKLEQLHSKLHQILKEISIDIQTGQGGDLPGRMKTFSLLMGEVEAMVEQGKMMIFIEI